ncbi:MAG: divergent polysaccharide deacetylase family protein [Rhodospirillales bacterium]|nr:divergent polysaccharide deacetylase family protein [Rhodospirillales bacterium]
MADFDPFKDEDENEGDLDSPVDDVASDMDDDATGDDIDGGGVSGEDDEDDFDEYDDDFDEYEGGGPNKKKLIVLAAAGAVVLLAITGAGILFLGGGGEEDQKQAQEQPQIAEPSSSLLPVVSMALPPRASAPGFKGGKRLTGNNRASEIAEPVVIPAKDVPSVVPQITASTQPQLQPGQGVTTPSVIAASFAGIPIQPQGKPLAGPDSSLIESSNYGGLPRMAKTGKAPWQVYSRPFSKDVNRPRIGIIIMDLGLSKAPTLAAMNQLSGEFSLAFSPYAENLEDWMGFARSAGHETLLAVPMEPLNFPISDPGPLAMLTSLSTAKNLDRLKRILALAPGYVGMVQVMGSKFTTSEVGMLPVLTEIQRRGLLYVDNGQVKDSQGVKIATKIALPRIRAVMTIDQVLTGKAISAQLNELEKLARKNASALAMARAHPITIRLLAEWAKNLDFKELALAPVSAMVRIDAPTAAKEK